MPMLKFIGAGLFGLASMFMPALANAQAAVSPARVAIGTTTIFSISAPYESQ